MTFTKIQSNITIWQYIVIHSNTICSTALTCIVSPLAAMYSHSSCINTDVTHIYLVGIYIHSHSNHIPTLCRCLVYFKPLHIGWDALPCLMTQIQYHSIITSFFHVCPRVVPRSISLGKFYIYSCK